MSEHKPPALLCTYGMSGRAPARSIEQYLADLQAEYDRLPMQSSRRGRLATLIRECEIAIDEASAL